MRPVDADEAKRIAREYLTDPYHVISAVAVLDKTPTLTPPNEWVSVEDTVPDPGERVLATDGIFVGEAYRTSADSWHRHTGFPWRDGVTGRTVKYWMHLPEPPNRHPPEGEEDT